MKNFKEWIKAAGIRAIKTVAQTAVATIGTSAVLGDVNWIAVASASALAGYASDPADAITLESVQAKLQAEIDGKIQMPDGGDAGDVLKKRRAVSSGGKPQDKATGRKMTRRRREWKVKSFFKKN